MSTTASTAPPRRRASGPGAPPARRPSGRALARTERRWGWLMVAPAVVGFLVFTFGPMVAAVLFSFTDWSIGGGFGFTGLANYTRMFTDDRDFGKSVWVTVYYTLLAVPATLLVGFAVAMLLNRDMRGKGFFRVVFYLPTIIPLVANSVLWIWMFNPDFGLLNQMLGAVHLPGSQWIYDESSSVPALAFMSTWGFGNAAVIFLAGLQGVPVHLYEAVDVDGGGAWAKFRYVTLPMMTPTIFYNLVTGFIVAVQIFVQSAVMTQGGPNNSTLFYVYYIYRTAFTNTQMGYACALASVLFVAIVVVTAVLFASSRRWVHYEVGVGR